MNAIQMVNELLSRFALDEVGSFGGTGSDSLKALRKLNLALRQIHSEHPFKWLHKNSVGTITAVNGTATYTLASDVKQLLIGKHTYQNGGWLHVVDRQTLETYVPKRSDSSQRNTPAFMIPFGRTQSGSNWLWQVELYPVPDSNFSGQMVDYYYLFTPSDLSQATDVPIMPEDFHYVAVDYAERLWRRGPLRVGGDQSQLDLYTAIDRECNKGLNRLIASDSVGGMSEASWEVSRNELGVVSLE